MEKDDKGSTLIRIGVSGWKFLLVPAYPGCPGSKAVKRSLYLIFCIFTHTFNGPFSGTTRVSRFQKGKTNLDVTEARDSEWQWHQLGHMQVCTSLQTDNHANTPLLVFCIFRKWYLHNITHIHYRAAQKCWNLQCTVYCINICFCWLLLFLSIIIGCFI